MLLNEIIYESTSTFAVYDLFCLCSFELFESIMISHNGALSYKLCRPKKWKFIQNVVNEMKM